LFDYFRWSGKEFAADITEKVEEWVENGATWIGGCCRIYPADISKIKQKLTAIETQKQ